MNNGKGVMKINIRAAETQIEKQVVKSYEIMRKRKMATCKFCGEQYRAKSSKAVNQCHRWECGMEREEELRLSNNRNSLKYHRKKSNERRKQNTL